MTRKGGLAMTRKGVSWCKGSTEDFESSNLGSIPSETVFKTNKKMIFFY